jgi:hypothetical protein
MLRQLDLQFVSFPMQLQHALLEPTPEHFFTLEALHRCPQLVYLVRPAILMSELACFWTFRSLVGPIALALKRSDSLLRGRKPSPYRPLMLWVPLFWLPLIALGSPNRKYAICPAGAAKSLLQFGPQTSPGERCIRSEKFTAGGADLCITELAIHGICSALPAQW